MHVIRLFHATDNGPAKDYVTVKHAFQNKNAEFCGPWLCPKMLERDVKFSAPPRAEFVRGVGFNASPIDAKPTIADVVIERQCDFGLPSPRWHIYVGPSHQEPRPSRNIKTACLWTRQAIALVICEQCLRPSAFVLRENAQGFLQRRLSLRDDAVGQPANFCCLKCCKSLDADRVAWSINDTVRHGVGCSDASRHNRNARIDLGVRCAPFKIDERLKRNDSQMVPLNA